MKNFGVENNGQMQKVELSSVLLPPMAKDVKESTEGHVFQEKDFAKDWDSIYVKPSDLDYGVVKKGMRKVTEPVLVLTTRGAAMAYVFASVDEPVFFVSDVCKSETVGWTILSKIGPFVMPEYFYYMCKYGEWGGIVGRVEYDNYLGLGWKDVGICEFDGEREFYISPKSVLLSCVSDITIPTLQVQQQRIADAQAMEKMIQDKMAEKWRKFEQKEWLNEAHIRNSKHRLSNEIMPIRMQVERLREFFAHVPEGVKLTDVIGHATKQTVSDLLESLYASVRNVEKEIENLTKSETAGEPVVVLDVATAINDYCDKIAVTYTPLFKIEKIGFEKGTRIRISPKDFIELFKCIVENAVRHGFVENRNDYVVQISIEKIGGKCRISFANNGLPMSERAVKEYFVRESIAGPTGNTGIGGARVFEICDRAGGEALQPYAKEGFPVVVSVEFPLV